MATPVSRKQSDINEIHLGYIEKNVNGGCRSCQISGENLETGKRLFNSRNIEINI